MCLIATFEIKSPLPCRSRWSGLIWATATLVTVGLSHKPTKRDLVLKSEGKAVWSLNAQVSLTLHHIIKVTPGVFEKSHPACF